MVAERDGTCIVQVLRLRLTSIREQNASKSCETKSLQSPSLSAILLAMLAKSRPKIDTKFTKYIVKKAKSTLSIIKTFSERSRAEEQAYAVPDEMRSSIHHTAHH